MRAPALHLTLATLLAASLSSACHGKERASASASGNPRPSAAPRATPNPSATASAAPRTPGGCRVLAARGSAAKEPGAPAAGRFFGTGEWLDLGADVELSLRHTETTREFMLRGPGRFQVCKAGAEAVMVVRGTVATSAGPGARAGAEVLLGTPFGVVHYADATLTLTLSDQKLSLTVEQGSASVETSGADSRVRSKTITGPKGVLTLAGPVEPEKLVKACGDAWAAVGPGTLKRSGQAGAGADLGEWAANQLKARRTARFLCAQARAAVGRLAGAELAHLSDLLDAAEPSGHPTRDAGK